jgi:hypothetical protein
MPVRPPSGICQRKRGRKKKEEPKLLLLYHPSATHKVM